MSSWFKFDAHKIIKKFRISTKNRYCCHSASGFNAYNYVRDVSCIKLDMEINSIMSNETLAEVSFHKYSLIFKD